MRTATVVILACVAAILIIGGIFFWAISQPDGNIGEEAERTYTSDAYGFSFEVPRTYEINEYSDEAIAIGSSTEGGGFTSVAEVVILESGDEGGYENYDAFLFESARNMCAADGPRETIRCDRFEDRQPFTSQNGLAGDFFYLHRIHENLGTGETTEDRFGPIFAFNVGANVPRSAFAALLVRPPAPLSADAVNADVIRSVADSLELNAVGEEGGEEVFCTQEALMCPGGSFVGRGGSDCAFDACPMMSSLSGELRGDSAGYQLIIPSPEGSPEATYAVPLVLRATNVVGELIGRQVIVYGHFTTGNTYVVESLEALEDGTDAGGAELGTVGVGETKIVGGVEITFNELVADYRCPVDTECMEGGAITANVTFQRGTETATFNMPSDEAPRPFDGFQISIAEVNPPLVSTEEINPNEYRVTFRVEEVSN